MQHEAFEDNRGLQHSPQGRIGWVLLAATSVVALLLSAIVAPPAAAVETPIEVSATALDFGDVAVGGTAQISVQVTNTSASPFGPINMFGGAPPTAEFNASQNCQAKTLAAGASCQINYTFSPTSLGSFSDSSNFTISPTANQSDGENFAIALRGRSGPPPTITSFTPTEGEVGAPVVITGTGFTGTSSVEFNGVPATFTADSATQITAKVPAGATTGPIKVTAPTGTATSTTNFTVVPPPPDIGGFTPPDIRGFTPTVGRVGASVVIRGTGFAGTTSVQFNGVPATFTADSATRITTKVPAGARTGRIKVTATTGTATSTENFRVVVRHRRTVAFKLRRHLVARTRVSVRDGFTRCRSRALVQIQRRIKGTWRTIDIDVTGRGGRSREFLPDRRGRYRARVKARTLNNGADVCAAATSRVVRHRH